MGLITWFKNLFASVYDIKTLKLIALVVLLIWGTGFFARKSVKINERLNIYLKQNITSSKDLSQVKIIQINPIDSISKSSLQKLVKDNHFNGRIDLARIKLYEDKYRVNDTLYMARLFLDGNDSLIAIEKPIKL